MAEPGFDADVIVIGAGPAGSAAATTAARAGRDVLLVDRQSFPRDKPCGDLIGARAMRAARRLGVDERTLTSSARLDGVLVTTTTRDLVLAPASAIGRWAQAGSDARVIPRLRFDDAVRRTALRAGARFERGHARRVSAWDGAGRIVHLQHDRQLVALRARLVVVAGGYGCRVADDVAPPRPAHGRERPHGIAMRGYLRGVTAPERRIVFCLDEWTLPGYGWLFPLPDGRANVGIGTLVRRGDENPEHLRDLYARFVTDPGSPIARWLRDAVADGEPRAWPLDLGPRARRASAPGLLVAGEAAALVGPMTGAGIAFALESGAWAGEVAAHALTAGIADARALEPYARWLDAHPLRWLRVEARAHWLVSDADRLRRVTRVTHALPGAGPLGAKLLLALG